MPSTIDLLNKITKKKRSQVPVLDYLRKVDLKLHDRLKSCASHLLLREWVESGEVRVRNANFCKRHQICPACAVRRGAKLAENGLERIQAVLSEEKELKPLHVTLTLKNTKDVGDGIDQIKTAWSKMIAHRRKSLNSSRGHNLIEWCKVQGGVKSIEVTNKGKGWHPHIHALVLATDYIDRVKLSKEFQRFGGGKIVWVNKIGGEEQDLVSALLEVLKYPTKFSDLSPKQRYEFWLGSRKTRLTDTFGNLRGVGCGDIDQDDLDLSGEYRDWIAKWYHRKQGYMLWRANSWDDHDEDSPAQEIKV